MAACHCGFLRVCSSGGARAVGSRYSSAIEAGLAMMFKDHFSTSARGYSRFRPRYPEAVFGWLADLAPSRGRAWDAATGTGQAAHGLAPYFEEVIATDASLDQIRHARAHPVIRFEVARSEYVPIENGSIDLVVVAQALHWFEFDAFYSEVRRVTRPGGIVAALSYGLFRIDTELDRVIDDLYHGALGEYWPAERSHVDDQYARIPFPFRELPSPDFAMEARWTLEHLLGYLGTWSAVTRAREKAGKDPLVGAEAALRRAWGEPLEYRDVTWPLAVRVGCV
jgi:SAM-dependent methyltransferase